MARADSGLIDTLTAYDLSSRIPQDRLFANLDDAVEAFRAATASA